MNIYTVGDLKKALEAFDDSLPVRMYEEIEGDCLVTLDLNSVNPVSTCDGKGGYKTVGKTREYLLLYPGDPAEIPWDKTEEKVDDGYGVCSRCGKSSDSIYTCIRCGRKTCEDCTGEDEMTLGVCCQCGDDQEDGV